MKILKYSILLLTILVFFSQPCPGEMHSTVYGKVIDEETGIGIKGVGVRIGLFKEYEIIHNRPTELKKGENILDFILKSKTKSEKEK